MRIELDAEAVQLLVAVEAGQVIREGEQDWQATPGQGAGWRRATTRLRPLLRHRQALIQMHLIEGGSVVWQPTRLGARILAQHRAALAEVGEVARITPAGGNDV